jgi:hypothetical protein
LCVAIPASPALSPRATIFSGRPEAAVATPARPVSAQFGPEIGLRDLLDRFSYDCLWRAEARSKKGKSACGVYLPDLEQPRPPDLPPA